MPLHPLTPQLKDRVSSAFVLEHFLVHCKKAEAQICLSSFVIKYNSMTTFSGDSIPLIFSKYS